MLHNDPSLKYNQAIVALGSNLPGHRDSPFESVTTAISALGRLAGAVCARSRLYQTPGYPVGTGPDFVNAAVLIETTHSPEALLEILHSIETDFGRTRAVRWGPRTLDLDLIAYGNVIRPSLQVVQQWISLPAARQLVEVPETLILPHPRLHERGFVLVPMADIVPNWRHPLLNNNMREMCAALEPAALAQITAVLDKM